MDWDSIADKLKEGFDEDTVKNLIETLKQAEAAAAGGDKSGKLDAGELAKAIGEIMGKFGAGAVGGATGLDPDLLRFILELLGPLARDALGELIRSFTGGDGQHYRVADLGGFKYAKIVKDPPGADFEESKTPDVVVTDRMRPRCNNGSVELVLKMQVKVQEEPISSVHALGMGVAGAPAYPAFEKAGEKKIPAVDDQDVGDFYEVTLTFDVPCTALFNNGGVMIFVITVEDADGNQMICFFEADVADFLLKDKCCATEIDAVLRARLLEIIRNGMRPLTPADLERLIDLIVRPKSETRPPAPPQTPKAAPKTGGGGKLGDSLAELPIEELVFEDGREIAPPPGRGGQSTKRPR